MDVISKVNIDIDGNKIYDDSIDLVVHPVAETVALIPRAIKAALAPLEKWVLLKKCLKC